MDTSAGPSAKKSLRASLTAQYDARVASTLEKVDPNRAKAKEILQEEDMDTEALTGEFEAFKEPLPEVKQTYMEAPLLTLRELMPGATGDDDDSPDLDQSSERTRWSSWSSTAPCHGMRRRRTPSSMMLDVDWSIPDQSELRTSWAIQWTSIQTRSRS